jgi:hypothetical protein
MFVMLAIFLAASTILLAVAETWLEGWLREWLHARRGLHTLDRLEALTGVSREELRRRATRSPDGLWAIDPPTLASLPRAPLRASDVVDHPLVAVVTTACLAAGVVVAIRSGEPAWWFLAGGASILCVSVVVACAGASDGEDDEDEHGLLALEAQIDALDQDRRQLGLVDEASRLVAMCDQLEAATRWEARSLVDPTVPLTLSLVARLVGWWTERTARRLTRSAETLEREARAAREELRDLLEPGP